jgi:hypothetical protein
MRERKENTKNSHAKSAANIRAGLHFSFINDFTDLDFWIILSVLRLKLFGTFFRNYSKM